MHRRTRERRSKRSVDSKPVAALLGLSAPPTFLWVLENPGDEGLFHAHWAVYVPVERQADFAVKLERWLKGVASKLCTPEPIHIKPVDALLGLGEYLLKGQFPTIARDHGITPECQGWIPGKKRSGCSKNLGPTRHEEVWRAGRHPRPERYRQNKHQPRTRVMQCLLSLLITAFLQTVREPAV